MPSPAQNHRQLDSLPTSKSWSVKLRTSQLAEKFDSKCGINNQKNVVPHVTCILLILFVVIKVVLDGIKNGFFSEVGGLVFL